MNKKTRITFFTALLLALQLLTQTAQAAEDEWSYVLSPLFLWGKSINGVSAIGGNENPLDMDFRDDILENLDSSFTLHFEANKGRASYFAEINYARLDPTTTTTIGSVTINADVDYVDIMSEAGMFWSIADNGKTRWELMGGVRYYDQDVKVNFTNEDDSSGQSALVRGGDSWWNGIVGLRVNVLLSENWSLRLRGDYGYGGSNNDTLHGLGLLNYRFKDWGSFFVGYRFMATDYDNEKLTADGYKFDADQQGPALGINFHFLATKSCKLLPGSGYGEDEQSEWPIN